VNVLRQIVGPGTLDLAVAEILDGVDEAASALLVVEQTLEGRAASAPSAELTAEALAQGLDQPLPILVVLGTYLVDEDLYPPTVGGASALRLDGGAPRHRVVVDAVERVEAGLDGVHHRLGPEVKREGVGPA
jgi:hypothetical protein